MKELLRLIFNLHNTCRCLKTLAALLSVLAKTVTGCQRGGVSRTSLLKPWVLKALRSRHALMVVFDEQLANKVLGIFRHSVPFRRRELVISGQDFVKQFALRFAKNGGKPQSKM